VGVDAALECVGTQQSIDTAAAIARPGSTIGIVGVPHGEVPFDQTFFRNVGWRGGLAPARRYIPELRCRSAAALRPVGTAAAHLPLAPVPRGSRDERDDA
jgi:threonine dehydrogenase-like Zn-dependent dehydrogenase